MNCLKLYLKNSIIGNILDHKQRSHVKISQGLSIPNIYKLRKLYYDLRLFICKNDTKCQNTLLLQRRMHYDFF